jgi:hypothetical protein
MGGACSMHGRQEMHAKFRFGKLKGRNHLEDLGTDGRIISKWILKKQGVKVWIGFISFRIWTSGGFL